MGKKWYYIILFLITPVLAYPQIPVNKINKDADSVTEVSDSTIHFLLKPIDIFPDKKDMNPRQLREYTLLEMKVKKSIPSPKCCCQISRIQQGVCYF